MGRKKKLNTKKTKQRKIFAQSNFKSGDDKVKIKKIKKQNSEKRIYNIKDYVVYPKHGVGKLISVDIAKIGEIEITF